MSAHPVISQHHLAVSIQEDTICLVFARASSGCQRSSHEQAAVENSRGPESVQQEDLTDHASEGFPMEGTAELSTEGGEI